MIWGMLLLLLLLLLRRRIKWSVGCHLRNGCWFKIKHLLRLGRCSLVVRGDTLTVTTRASEVGCTVDSKITGVGRRYHLLKLSSGMAMTGSWR